MGHLVSVNQHFRCHRILCEHLKLFCIGMGKRAWSSGHTHGRPTFAVSPAVGHHPLPDFHIQQSSECTNADNLRRLISPTAWPSGIFSTAIEVAIVSLSVLPSTPFSEVHLCPENLNENWMQFP